MKEMLFAHVVCTMENQALFLRIRLGQTTDVLSVFCNHLRTSKWLPLSRIITKKNHWVTVKTKETRSSSHSRQNRWVQPPPDTMLFLPYRHARRYEYPHWRCLTWRSERIVQVSLIGSLLLKVRVENSAFHSSTLCAINVVPMATFLLTAFLHYDSW